MAILRIRDANGQVKEIVALRGEKGQDGTVAFDDLTDEQKASLKGEKGDKGDNAVTDQTYDPTSENAQSGVAVAEAIESNIDQSANATSRKAQSGFAVAEAVEAGIKIYTNQEYSPESENPQSGVAVAQAIASIPTGGEKEWELLEEIALPEDAVVIEMDASKMNAKNEVHIEGYIIPKNTTITNQSIGFNDGGTCWRTNVSCKSTGKVYLIMDLYKSPRNMTVFDGGVSAYSYTSGIFFRTTTFNGDLSVSSNNLLLGGGYLKLLTSDDNPMTIGTRIKVWGR